jgi:hypothetical protein
MAMKITAKGMYAGLCALVLTGTIAVAQADARVVVHEETERDYVLDHRYNHDHYYPPQGYVVRALPPSPYFVRWQGGAYYLHDGAWYRPYHSHYIVVTPPVGLFVPALPRFYTTIWVSGAPYYYADDVYYAWRPAQHGYVVVDPPADESMVSTAPTTDDIYVYPKDGQSPQQEATDRYECHRWASDQTGFDPTRPEGGVASNEVTEKRGDYHRAITACLDGRGYSVT